MGPRELPSRITLSHKIRLQPTEAQEAYFRRACGVARFVFNWALERWREEYEAGEKPSALGLKKQLNAMKREAYPWMYEVTKYAAQQPFFHLQAAFKKFFEKQARHPRFKKKGVHDSFYIGNDHVKVEGKRIHIPKLGWVRMRENLRFTGKLVSATVSRTADLWFVSLTVELKEAPERCESQAAVGVDLGVNRLATLSNGERIAGPKPLQNKSRELKKLRRLSRRQSRKRKGSRNREKARLKLARLHYRIRCIRQDALHKLTTRLTRNYAGIAIEDLNVKGMLSNRRLARAISDMGFHEFRRQLQYKAALRRNHIEVVDRWYPSTKMCSQCWEVKQELPLNARVFCCETCGLKMDRDENAARNLYHTVSSTGIYACGERGSGSSFGWSEPILYEAGT
jgi:putative transposase